VDVFVVSGQRPGKDIDNRSFPFCYFGSNQCDSYLAISVDQRDSPLAHPLPLAKAAFYSIAHR
jgi:hypothetical protein